MIIKTVLKHLDADSKGHDFKFVLPFGNWVNSYYIDIKKSRYYKCSKCKMIIILHFDYDYKVALIEWGITPPANEGLNYLSCNQIIMKKACQ